MTRPVTYWYTKQLAKFENNDDLEGAVIDVTRMPAGADNPPSLKISHTSYEQVVQFIRICHFREFYYKGFRTSGGEGGLGVPQAEPASDA